MADSDRGGEYSTHPYAEDGRFHFQCENGHNITQDAPDLAVCPAILPWPVTPRSKPCGADVDYRLIPNTPITARTPAAKSGEA